MTPPKSVCILTIAILQQTVSHAGSGGTLTHSPGIPEIRAAGALYRRWLSTQIIHREYAGCDSGVTHLGNELAPHGPRPPLQPHRLCYRTEERRVGETCGSSVRSQRTA